MIGRSHQSVDLSFIPANWESVSFVHRDELISRLRSKFSNGLFNCEKGDELVALELEKLIESGAPEVIVESHKAYFGNVAYCELHRVEWGDVTVNGYLYSIRPPLGDAVQLNVDGSTDPALVGEIVNKLADALEMERILDRC